MSGFAEPADWLLTARYVVTMDASKRVISNGAVAVRGEKIVGVGERAAMEKRFQARQRVDGGESVILPGLISTHTHAAMSLLRGVADDMALQEWLTTRIFPAEGRNLTAEFVRWGTLLACAEMMLSGTTTFTDMYYFKDAVAQATKRAGMRGVLGQTIIGFPVADAKTPADSLRLTEQFLEKYRNDELVIPAASPHALYTNTDETLRAARELANRFDAPLLIHVAETKKERDDSLASRGASPVQALDRLGIFTGRTIAAHCVWVDDADLATLKQRGTGIAHCPSSNMKLSSGVAPVTKMLALDLPVGLGPDGPAGSNNDFNLFEEMDLAAKLQKLSTNDPRALPARSALEMATIRGARALGLEQRIGSIEEGKLADLVRVRLDGAHATPVYDIVSQLVYASKGSDVDDVMIHGRFTVRGRRLLTLDLAELRAKAAQYGESVARSLKQ